MPTVVGLSKSRLWLELMLVFMVLPLLCWLYKLPVIVALLVACAFVIAVILRDPTFDRRCLKRWPREGKIWRQIILVWLGATLLLAGLVWWLQPDLFLYFPREKPLLWLLVMVAYPLVSVVPQEIIYRAFFCHRYAPLFGHGHALALAGATVFGLAHVVFGNWVAVTLTLAGGWLFIRTFQQTQSLACVAIQHALFGSTVFTVGLGKYLLQGTTRFLEQLLPH